MNVHVFAGPTISDAEVRAALPHAVVHPPAAHGDLLRLAPTRGDTVAIVDGYFYERAPLRHKEILECLESGVTVVGASSIGALRASELHSFGMHGVGTIYRMYRRGLIDADDEVAVLHASAEDGYRSVTVALVNIRASCREARRRGLIGHAEARAVIAHAVKMPFHRRSWRDLQVRLIDEVGVGRARQIIDHCRASHTDLKNQDAVQLVDWLQVARSRDTSRMWSLPRTRFVGEWTHWEAETDPRWPEVRAIHVLSLVQALDDTYPELQMRALLAAYVDNQHWLTRNQGLAPVSLEELEDRAWERAQERGLFGVAIPDSIAAMWLVPAERKLRVQARAARIIARSHRAMGLLPLRSNVITEVARRYDWASLVEKVGETHQFTLALKERNADHDVARLSEDSVRDYYLMRWKRVGQPVVALAERGFVDMRDLSQRAGAFMLAARFNRLDLALR